MTEQVVETAPRLRLSELRASGLLQGHEAEVWVGDLAVRARLLDASRVALKWASGEQVVLLDRQAATFGQITYFVTPEGSGRCTSLFLSTDGFVSRKAAGLSYASQRMAKAEREDARLDRVVAQLQGSGPRTAARGENRQRLLGELEAAQERLSPAGWAELDREEERRRRARRRRPLKRDPVMGTRWALVRGRRQRLTSADVKEHLNKPPSPRLLTLPSTGLPQLAEATAAKTEAAELDIRLLRPKRGAARGRCLEWGEGPTLFSVLSLIFEDDGHMVLLLEIWCGEKRDIPLARQTIALVGGARQGDLFMICPVTGRRIVKAYQRAGRFASLSAQRLR